MPEIGVVIPVYNQARYVSDCLESLVKQNFNDFEVFVVDDGSTDGSAAVIREYEKQDGRFHLVEQSNAGVSVARNNGLAHVSSPWACFIDPDDYVDEEYLHTLFDAAHTYSGVDVVMSTCVAFSDDGSADEKRQHFFPASFNATTRQQKIPLFHQLMEGAYQQNAGFVTAIGVPWGKLYRTDFLREHGLSFDAGLPRMQDNLFNMQVFEQARTLVYLDYAGYHYRMGGLTKRTYENNAKGLYHPAIDKRAQLMHDYGLDTEPELVTAWNVEQVNLYFQELKGVAMLASKNYAAMRKAASTRAQVLAPRLQRIDTRALPKTFAFKYQIMTNAALRGAFIFTLYARR